MVICSQTKVFLWAIGISVLICGIPSLGFVDDHPFVSMFSLALGSLLGIIWGIVAKAFVRRQYVSILHFALFGGGTGIVGAAVWGVFSWYYFKDVWVVVFIAGALLVLTIAGMISSVIGRNFLNQDTSSSKGGLFLGVLMAVDLLLFGGLPVYILLAGY